LYGVLIPRREGAKGDEMAEQHIKLSRVGKRPITLPAGVECKFEGRKVTVKGPKGTLTRELVGGVGFKREGNVIEILLEKDERDLRAAQGLVRALLNNMVVGVSQGFERQLEIIGVGYRAELKNPRELLFQLGYSHPILYELPDGVNAEVGKDNKVTLRSIDRELLGLAAAKIRSFRKPEPYKGKGVRIVGETVRHKAGKAAAR
jgi:large subunit ribosomal protein L6